MSTADSFPEICGKFKPRYSVAARAVPSSSIGLISFYDQSIKN